MTAVVLKQTTKKNKKKKQKKKFGDVSVGEECALAQVRSFWFILDMMLFFFLPWLLLMRIFFFLVSSRGWPTNEWHNITCIAILFRADSSHSHQQFPIQLPFINNFELLNLIVQRFILRVNFTIFEGFMDVCPVKCNTVFNVGCFLW